MRSRVVALVAVAAIGTVAGYLIARPSERSSSRELRRQQEQLEAIQQQLAALTRAPAVQRVQPEGPDRGQTPLPAEAVDKIARRVAEELSRDAGTPAAPEPTAENLAAYHEADRVLSDALGAKRWTDRDNEEMSRFAARLTGEHKMELTRKFVVAINAGRIRVETSDPPFW